MGRSVILVLTLTALLAGCGTSRDWTRGQGTAAEREAFYARKTQDENTCKQTALEEAVNGSLCGRADPADDSIDARATRICAFNNCMQRKGWKDCGGVTPAANVRIVP